MTRPVVTFSRTPPCATKTERAPSCLPMDFPLAGLWPWLPMVHRTTTTQPRRYVRDSQHCMLWLDSLWFCGSSRRTTVMRKRITTPYQRKRTYGTNTSTSLPHCLATTSQVTQWTKPGPVAPAAAPPAPSAYGGASASYGSSSYGAAAPAAYGGSSSYGGGGASR